MVSQRNKTPCCPINSFQASLHPDQIGFLGKLAWKISEQHSLSERSGWESFNIGVSYTSKGAAFLERVSDMVGFYRLVGPHTVEFTYRGERNFDIKVMNGSGLEIQYDNVLNDDVIVIDSDSDEEDPEEPTYWKVTLTKAAADGSNPLHIPSKFVREIGLKYQKSVSVIESGTNFHCKVIQHKRNRKSAQRYLGLGWYQLCR
ncbi:DNA-binding barrel domain superfamily [Sesbania bispinosa]|nr:DNA-binding barrel domain superfamily [Sesbania bispinosa]